MVSKQEVATFLRALKKIIPTYAPDFDEDGTMTLWHQAFAHLTMEDLRKAYTIMRDTENHFPSVKKILDCLKLEKQDTFDELIALIGKFGGYKAPETTYAMSWAIQRLGGWQKVCNWTDDEIPFRQKDFQEIYADVSGSMKVANHAHLPPIRLQGAHTSLDCLPDGQIKPLMIEAPPTPPQTPPEDNKSFWDDVRAFFEPMGLYLDHNLPQRLVDRGFFKLDKIPDTYFRYCYGQKPGKGTWPYSFVDADDHMAAMNKKKTAPEDFVDKSRFDSSKYSYEQFVD